jgi:hypothetical protein
MDHARVLPQLDDASCELASNRGQNAQLISRVFLCAALKSGAISRLFRGWLKGLLRRTEEVREGLSQMIPFPRNEIRDEETALRLSRNVKGRQTNRRTSRGSSSNSTASNAHTRRSQCSPQQ